MNFSYCRKVVSNPNSCCTNIKLIRTSLNANVCVFVCVWVKYALVCCIISKGRLGRHKLVEITPWKTIPLHNTHTYTNTTERITYWSADSHTISATTKIEQINFGLSKKETIHFECKTIYPFVNVKSIFKCFFHFIDSKNFFNDSLIYEKIDWHKCGFTVFVVRIAESGVFYTEWMTFIFP